MPEASSRRRSFGFSLVEVIVVLTILSLFAGALGPAALRQMDAARRQSTRERMAHIVHGLLGDPQRGDFGYLGDMGELPPTLEDLNDATGKPAYSIAASDGVGYGWAGPYAASAAPAASAFVDSWGRSFQYASGSAQITSAGPDRQVGTSDDLSAPFVAPRTTGNLSLTVLGTTPGGGSPPQQLTPAEVGSVTVFSSNSGTRQGQGLSGANPYSATGLHNGFHGVEVVGAGSYAGVTVRDVVAVRGGQARLTITLEHP